MVLWLGVLWLVLWLVLPVVLPFVHPVDLPLDLRLCPVELGDPAAQEVNEMLGSMAVAAACWQLQVPS